MPAWNPPPIRTPPGNPPPTRAAGGGSPLRLPLGEALGWWMPGGWWTAAPRPKVGSEEIRRPTALASSPPPASLFGDRSRQRHHRRDVTAVPTGATRNALSGDAGSCANGRRRDQ